MRLRLGVLAATLAWVGAAADHGSLTPAQRQLNLESFERVWTTVRDQHWDATLGGLDWQAIHNELRPKVESAATMEEARAVMSGMLQRLHQTHFGIVAAAAYQEMDAPGSREANPGMDVRILEGRAVVVSVDPGSPAAERGVKPGWVIVRVDGKELALALGHIQESLGASTLLEVVQMRAVTARLSGEAGKPARVEFLDARDAAVEMELGRTQPRGKAAKLGYLPPMYFWVEGRQARPGIGYVRFNLFFEPETLVGTFRDMVTSCRECSGFVIDLRGNPGGIGGLAMGLAGWFIDKPGKQLGTMIMRNNTIKFVVFPRPDAFPGPLAILVDGCSASTSEIFAEGLKDLKRARIFGTRTAAAALPSVFERLPNGDGFQYALANYISEGGKPLEGIGVIPDERIQLTRHQLLKGQDEVLNAALGWIESQKK